MSSRTLLALLTTLLTSALLVACGSAPPPVVVTTRVERNDPPPPCAEDWVHMPIHIGFPTGGTEIDHQNRIILSEMVRTAQTRDDIRRVRVEGHTDSCGAESANFALSEQRARTVAAELTTMGVPAEMMEMVGYASTQPLGDEDCQRDQMLTRQVNRRVEFSLLVCR